MPAPTTSWLCDRCGHLIEQADHGWVEWIRVRVPDGAPELNRDMRIVHHDDNSPRRDGCQFDSDREHAKDGGMVGDDSLTYFSGANGLTRLLEMIAEGDMPTPDVLEIIKRIHIPGYEHARRHFNRALAEGVIELNVTRGEVLTFSRTVRVLNLGIVKGASRWPGRSKQHPLPRPRNAGSTPKSSDAMPSR